MADNDPGGPSHRFASPGGDSIPMYLISFDKDGNCLSPLSRAHVLAAAASGEFSDVHIYSHGWNNVFQEALDHYTEFFTEYFKLPDIAVMRDAGYQPLIVGVIWPSTALLSNDERTPDLAGTAPTSSAPLDLHEHEMALAELSANMPPADAARFAALARRGDGLSPAESLELATLLAPVLRGLADAADGDDAAPEQLLRAWSSDPAPAPGVKRGAPAALPDRADGVDALESAGLLSFLNPREIIRKATVYLMKDRAGVVGANGVRALVRDLVASRRVRIHLAGHSYGAKVVLSALAGLDGGDRVASLLLLQPAVNAFCFAASITEQGGRAGGYRSVLDKTQAPIYCTYSSNDKALTDFFPLALRRRKDPGEMAGRGGLFAALGGVGPQGMADAEIGWVPMLASPQRYVAAPDEVRVMALKGSDGMIKSHGDVRNAYTEWALVNLVRQGMTT